MAHHFKKEARQHIRRANGRYNQDQSSPGAMPSGGADTNGELAGESSPLISREQTRESNKPKIWGESDPAITKYPKEFVHLTWLVLASNYVNVLLVFVPLGIISNFVGWSPTVVFILNFLAIIPLAALLSFATEELSAKLGQTLGGLMNATFGNAVELIVSIMALRRNEIRIVQSSMLGSILSNILLVLGCCFLAGGANPRNPSEQEFNMTVASTMSSLMAVASASLIIPATLYAQLRDSNADSGENILVVSRGTSVILLLIYILYLYFQLKSHANLFDAEAQGEGEEEGEQLLSPYAATVALVLVTILVALCAEYLVDSIDSIVESTGISKTFIGLILLPIVGNAAEHVTACVVAWKNKMDLAINVAIGSSLQIALFVTPFLVILGWIMHKDMTLHFETFETVVFFVSVLVVNYLIQDGKSNYLEGALCIGLYTIIALSFWVYPDDAGQSGMLGGLFHSG